MSYQKKQIDKKFAVSLGFFFCVIFCELSILYDGYFLLQKSSV